MSEPVNEPPAPKLLVQRLTPNPFYRLCYNTPVKSIVPKRKIVAISTSDTVVVAMTKIFENKVLAVPVFDENDQCIGALDVLTILQYPIHSLVDEADNRLLTSQEVWNAVRNLTAQEVLSKATDKNLIPFYNENPVSMLIDLFATGVHRVALFGTDHRLSSTCSQSDVVSFIAQSMSNPKTPNFDEIKKAIATPVSEMSLLRPVETIPNTLPAMSALRQLARSHRRALAVVDKDGKMSAEFSTTNIHQLPEVNFDSLGLPVLEWVTKYARASLRPACTTTSATLGQVIESLAARRLHRLWIVNSEGKPTHIVSLTDVLRVLSSGDTIDARKASGDAELTCLWKDFD